MYDTSAVSDRTQAISTIDTSQGNSQIVQEQDGDSRGKSKWSLGTRVAFRFVFVYLLFEYLYIANSEWLLYRYFLFHKLGFGFADPFYHRVVPWIGAHILHLNNAITVFSNGSGDTTYDQVLLLTELFLATVVTVIWSSLDRKRENYRKLFTWLRAIVSFFLAAEMIAYGFDKVFPLQFGTINPMRAAQSVGNLTGEGMLWTFMAASTAYTIFGGMMEVVSGVLLFFPRFRTLGALLTIGVMGDVFALNMDYNVPVKLASLQYLLMAFFLVVPEIARLSDVFLFNRPTGAVVYAPLFQQKRRNRTANAVYALLALFTFSLSFYASGRMYGMQQRLSNAPKPALYGVWNIEHVAMQGASESSLLSGDSSWRQLIFTSPKIAIVQPVSGAPYRVNITTNAKTGTIFLQNLKAPAWKAEFKVEISKPHTANLRGILNGEPIILTLHETDYTLMTRGFHWINEHSY